MTDKQKQLAIIAVAVLLLAAGVSKLVREGKLSLKFPGFNSSVPLIENRETRTVVDEENAVISTVEKTSPSVVAVGITQRLVNPFDPFSVPRSREQTIGTGFVISDKGVIVTNRHVVSDPTAKYSIATKDGKKYEITKIYRDPVLDLALVQTNATDIKPLDLGDSSKLKVGQTVIAIGNALGRFDNTVTTGVVSGLGRSVTTGDPFTYETENLENLIQTDAAINPGNSGGPLLNSKAQVIGVNVAVTEGAQNIGFAIPISEVKDLLNEFEQTGTISRPYLGVRYRFITKDVALMNDVPQGAYIMEIVKGSPAEKAGLQIRDIVTKIDGQIVNSEDKISEVISKKKVGEKLNLEVYSEEKTKSLTAILEQSPEQ